MAGGKGAQVCSTVLQSSIRFFLRDLEGIENLFYSLAVATFVHRGPTTLVWLGWASTVIRSSPSGAPTPRVCAESSLNLPLAP
jgi:hypothetical protein